MTKYSLYEKDNNFNALSEKQQKLFLTAIKLFSKNGFASTSTASIAKEAKVSEGLLFKTFGNKEKLLKRILEPIVIKITPPDLEMATDENHCWSLKLLVTNYYIGKIKLINENEDVSKIFIRECMYNPSILNSYKQLLANDFEQKMNNCFNCLKKENLIADWDNKYLFRAMNSALINYLLRNYLFKTKLRPERITYTIKATTKCLAPE